MVAAKARHFDTKKHNLKFLLSLKTKNTTQVSGLKYWFFKVIHMAFAFGSPLLLPARLHYCEVFLCQPTLKFSYHQSLYTMILGFMHENSDAMMPLLLHFVSCDMPCFRLLSCASQT